MNLNKAMIIGNLTRDPEVRTTPSGQTVANFSVATNFTWADQAGQKQEKAEFHNIVMWRKLAEIAGQYLKKGAKVYIEGRLQTRSWDDAANNNVKRYRTEIIADNMIMLDSRGSATSSDSGARSYGSQPSPAQDYSQSDVRTVNEINSTPISGDEINVEDIPF